MLWCPLEVPLWGTSNEHPQHMFFVEKQEKYQFFWDEKKCLIWSYELTSFLEKKIIGP